MLVLFGIMALITCVVMWATERVDRPRRRAARLNRMIQPAE